MRMRRIDVRSRSVVARCGWGRREERPLLFCLIVNDDGIDNKRRDTRVLVSCGVVLVFEDEEESVGSEDFEEGKLEDK